MKKDDLNIYYLPDNPRTVTPSDVTEIVGSQMRVQNAGQMRLSSGTLQSANYVAGSTGWQLTPTSADLNVPVVVDSLDIPDTTTANSFHVDTSGNMWIGATTFAAPAPFRVANTGDMDIGGTDATSWHVDAAGNMWWGSAGSHAAATVKISNAGVAAFNSIVLSSSVAISGIANNTSTDISLLDCTHDIAFSPTDNDTVAWGSGTITFSNGRTFSISSGNTGNMSALTYIYLDPGTSSTVLQTTTTAATAEGANKKLIAQAQNSASGINAIFLVQRGRSLNGTSGGVPVAISGSHISGLSVSGKSCTFDTGTIGGFTMSSTTLTATNFSVTSGAANTARVEVGTGSNIGGINSGNGASDIAFWAGSTHANRATAPYRVDMAGNLTATSATISGYALTSQLPTAETFTSSGTWTKPAGATRVFVQGWGGGGSGGNVSGTGAASGGGGGEYSEAYFAAGDLGATVTVTIGDGGAQVTSNDTAGNNGTDTTFGSHLTANGGDGGTFHATNPISGGGGGTPFNSGVNGLWGIGASDAVGGFGLYSAAGGGSASGSSPKAGGPSKWGGAGGGAASDGSGNPASGGTSSAGGGAGGAGARDGNATAGSVPGGGGGANAGTGNSGAGGKGKMIVTTFF